MKSEAKKGVGTLLVCLLGLVTLTVVLVVNLLPVGKKSSSEQSAANDYAFTYSRYDHEIIKVEPGNSGKDTFLCFTEDLDDPWIRDLDSAAESKDVIVLFPFSKITSYTQKVSLKVTGISFGFDDKDASLERRFLGERKKRGLLLFYRDGSKADIEDDYPSLSLLAAEEAPVGKKEGERILADTFSLIREKKSISTRDTLGHYTLINFWGTWCGPCVKEMPLFIDFKKKHPETSIIAIHSLSLEESAYDFFSEGTGGESWNDTGIDFVYENKKTPLYDQMGFQSIFPMTIVLDQYNIIRKIHTGSITAEKLIAYYNEYAQ